MISLHSELRKLNNEQVHQKLIECTNYERRVQSKILLLIQEIYARQIYLEMGYGSMVDYLVKEMKYSESTALRRISSAQILTLVPEAKEDFLNGDLNMSQLQKTAMVMREYKKQNPKELNKLPLAEKNKEIIKEALQKIKNQNSRDTEIILAKEFNIDPVPMRHQSKNTFTHHKDESVTMTIYLSKDQFEKLYKVKNLLSHVIPSHENAEVLEYLCDMLIKKKDKTSEIKYASDAEVSVVGSVGSPSDSVKSNAAIPQRKTVSLKLKRQVFSKFEKPCCQFKNSNGKICESHHQLEVEHIHPVWAGGNNELTNLTVLCSRHNKFKYLKQSGIL